MALQPGVRGEGGREGAVWRSSRVYFGRCRRRRPRVLPCLDGRQTAGTAAAVHRRRLGMYGATAVRSTDTSQCRAGDVAVRRVRPGASQVSPERRYAPVA